MYPKITEVLEQLKLEKKDIDKKRKKQLNLIVSAIKKELTQQKTAQLLFICTHNSRRSQLAQVWSTVYSAYNKINIDSFSGGTEVTFMHPNTLSALRQDGFFIQENANPKDNPIQTIRFGEKEAINCYSKLYDADENPEGEYLALMTCSEADENCPFIPTAKARIPFTFQDPKRADNSAEYLEVYHQTSRTIAREIIYILDALHPSAKSIKS